MAAISVYAQQLSLSDKTCFCKTLEHATVQTDDNNIIILDMLVAP